jgi:type VI secretion system protein ImpL
VLLTLSVQDLLTLSTAERQAQAAKLRARLAELQTELGMAPPVYVLLTKTDLLAGFNESFGDWPKEQRDQVWGFTLPHPAPADLGAAFDAAYAQLEQRLVDGLPERLQAIRQPEQRAAAFGFPQQLALLRPLLRDSFATIFATGGGLERTPQVRGVYFTSGTQEGTPIDRLMGTLGRAFGLERGAGQLLAGGQGKSFFLLRLLRDVVFAERGLGAWNAAAERRRQLMRMGGMAMCATRATPPRSPTVCRRSASRSRRCRRRLVVI